MRRSIVFASLATLAVLYSANTVETAAPAKKAKPAPKPAAQKQQTSHQAVEVPSPVFTWKTGLKVSISEGRAAPTDSLTVTYNGAGRDEPPGKTGFAHLFEHM